jgi:A/G-specific adenine glycosylase
MARPTDNNIAYLQIFLLGWFEKNGRKFPWRNPSATNYEKIISEVLLQRTKAETVAKFFPDFIKEYPSWYKLGDASEQELQDILKPIGLYKQRGARLFNLAQELKKRNGIFPKERNQVEEIPMMGQYLTNAYELFILKRPSPLLDVNMARVIERYFGPRKMADIRYDPYLQNLSRKLVDNPKTKEINWAVLDYSALICKAKMPLCYDCELNAKCSFCRDQFNS